MADAIGTELADAYRVVAEDVRRLDKDRFLAALFIPEPARRHSLALLAFSAEIARVRDVVSNPLPGEIRLQWWRDQIADASPAPNSPDKTAAPPLVIALRDTIDRFALPRAAFTNLIDARVFDLYDDPMPTLTDLEGYCGETVSALFQLQSLVLSGGSDPGTAETSGHAGVAYGLTGLMRAVAFHASRGQIYLPADVLARHGADPDDIHAGRTTPALKSALAELRALARTHLAKALTGLTSLPPDVRPAFLPLTLVAPLLTRMDRPGYDPFRTPVEIAQWQKQARLWWAAR